MILSSNLTEIDGLQCNLESCDFLPTTNGTCVEWTHDKDETNLVSLSMEFGLQCEKKWVR